ncbi:hypothetical protein L593_14560 [Salinarchaeum sp. Harcht-Bsk1]|nr:hypothetical protein L593_14560 [Salinarchaeum sp. Harcht-Bsk1]
MHRQQSLSLCKTVPEDTDDEKDNARFNHTNVRGLTHFATKAPPISNQTSACLIFVRILCIFTFLFLTIQFIHVRNRRE